MRTEAFRRLKTFLESDILATSLPPSARVQICCLSSAWNGSALRVNFLFDLYILVVNRALFRKKYARGRSDRRNKTVEQRSNDGRRRTVYTAFNFDGMVTFFGRILYVVYSHAGKVQRSPSIIVLYVHVINSLNETLNNFKVAATGIRNQYSPHSLHISKLLM